MTLCVHAAARLTDCVTKRNILGGRYAFCHCVALEYGSFCLRHFYFALRPQLSKRECVARRIACVDKDGAPMTPCGSCREFLMLLSPENAAAAFCLGGGLTKTLAELLPLPWESFGR